MWSIDPTRVRYVVHDLSWATACGPFTRPDVLSIARSLTLHIDPVKSAKLQLRSHLPAS